MNVFRPIPHCSVCLNQFQGLNALYRLHKTCPSDPGAAGLFQAALKAYQEHHKEHTRKEYHLPHSNA